jgi:hypothetical protein
MAVWAGSRRRVTIPSGLVLASSGVSLGDEVDEIIGHELDVGPDEQ